MEILLLCCLQRINVVTNERELIGLKSDLRFSQGETPRDNAAALRYR
ncbi:hypothetical protein [Scytonema sp. HK-05]|nr:hypothetical protein [Scytonema sp. HK-05]